MNQIIDFLRGLFGGGGSTPVDPEQPADPCKAPGCVDAKSRLDSARGRFTSTCNTLRSVRFVKKLVAMVVATPIWVIVVLIVVATILWFLGLGFLAIVLWTLVLVYALSWILVLVIARIEVALGAALNEAREALAKALQDVIAQCPITCQGDLSVPECPLA